MPRVVVVRVVVVRSQHFLKPSRAWKWYESKIVYVQPRVVVVRVVVVRVVVVRTQYFLSPAARVSGTRGSGARDSGMNEKFSKSTCTC